jgi:hypothetical protein
VTDARKNRKTLGIILVLLILITAAIAALLMTRRTAPSSIVGRWHQVGGSSEQMTFLGHGNVRVGEAPGSYIWIDAEHLMVEFPTGGPRLVWFSPRTRDMIWTNHQLGLVLRYTNEPGSFAKVRISEALGL